MITEAQKYTLSDRPKWWLPRLFKWLAILSAVVGLVMWVASAWLYSMVSIDVLALDGAEEEIETSFLEMTAGFLEEASILLIEILFVVAFLWLLAIAVDKIDQLVWLNASDEDREDILAKRKKKNAKNK